MTTLPYSEAAEGALIARLMVDPRPITSLQLTPEDFQVQSYRSAFRAMLSLTKQQKPIDLVTLGDEGVDLSGILDRMTPAHRAEPTAYAAIIKRDSFRRRYITRLSALVEQAEQSDDPQALIAALRDDATALSEGLEANDTLGRISLEDYRGAPEPPLLGLLSPQGTTILFGDGGDGKGWVAARLVAGLIATGKRVAIIDFEMQPAEWGYRLDRFGVGLNDVLYFSPSTTFDKWSTPETARLLRAENVAMLLVDSAMYASDTDDPYSPNGAVGYGRARKRLNNLPALLLAHIASGADKVFGSVFWKNEARITWRLNKDGRARYMLCRKANGYPDLEGKRLNVEYDEGRGILELHPDGMPWGEGLPA